MLVRMYLNGQFGSDPEDVNAYAASSFYAVDRYASYRADWGVAYDAGEIFVAGRYTTSNAIHQGAKLSGAARAGYFDWRLFFWTWTWLWRLPILKSAGPGGISMKTTRRISPGAVRALWKRRRGMAGTRCRAAREA